MVSSMQNKVANTETDTKRLGTAIKTLKYMSLAFGLGSVMMEKLLYRVGKIIIHVL